jgi:hypothetical protein
MLMAYGDGIDEFCASKNSLASMHNVADKYRLERVEREAAENEEMRARSA